MSENEIKMIPNSSQTPNILNDKLFPRLPEAEMRCLNYISRRTFGFHKEQDRISFSQFVDGIVGKDGNQLDYGTGLSRPSVSEALKNLRDAGAIEVIKNSLGNIYQINLDMDIEKVVKRVNQLRELTKSGKATLPKSVKLLNLQKKGKKEKESIPRQAAKQKSLHSRFVETWNRLVQESRKIQPELLRKLYSPQDFKNLKLLIDSQVITEKNLHQFEVFAAYYLSTMRTADGPFPAKLAVFLSKGIILGLIDKAKNTPYFWRDTEKIEDLYFRKNGGVDRQVGLKMLYDLKKTLLDKNKLTIDEIKQVGLKEREYAESSV